MSHRVDANPARDAQTGRIIGAVIIEVKSVASLLPVHEAQLLTYMKLAGIRKGLLINFNVPVLKDGVRRFVL